MKRTYLYICLLSVLALAPGCKKYLYETPINNSYDEIFWVNEKAADQSVAAGYHLLRNAVRNGDAYFIFGDMVADIYKSLEWNYATLLKSGNFRFGYVPYLEGQLWDWSLYYDAIAQSNLALERIPTIPESGWQDISRRDQLRGEAFFLRAYTYFQVLRIWGEPVIRLKPLQEDELDNPPSIPRSTDAEALKVIRQDIDSALKLLGGNVHPEGAVRAGKNAAYALLAHVSAWQHEYNTTLTAANEVINSGDYELADSAKLGTLWSGGSVESIFELSMLFNATFDESSGFYNSILQRPIRKSGSGTNFLNYPNLFLDSSQLADYPEPLYRDTVTDLRYKSWYYVESMTSTKRAILLKYSNVTYRDPKNETGEFSNNNLVLFRLADIVLLKAEAQANLNQESQALVTANEVIDKRRGLHYDPAKDGTVKEFLLDERSRELVGEGSIFFDMIRTKLLTKKLNAYAGERWEQKGYYWPINLRSLKQTNDKLTQNYYWATH